MKFFEKKRRLIAIIAAITVVITSVLVGHLYQKADAATTSSADTSSEASASINGTMMQYFEWNLPNSGTLWNQVADQADELAEAGFTALWLPPAYKGTSSADVGYGPYDLYDLGEFNQKGTVRTKYGTKDEYLNAINTIHENGMQVYADIVLNHKAGADSTETVNAVQVQSGNRNNTQSGSYNIAAWTVFNFSGRGNTYSSFKWNASCFDGVDYDNNQKTNAVFRFTNKSWDWQVDTENSNYDYLMYADVDFDNQNVVNELKSWGQWYVETANLDGFRLDAVKHIKYTFFSDWLTYLRQTTGKELFSVGEFWSGDVNKLNEYIEKTNGTTSLFDVPLHNNFYSASNGNGNYDMRYLGSGTLVSSNATHAVTFVDNHDTQPGQSLQSYVADWFKPLAYTYILTREGGYPCVFYGDYYGLETGGKSFKDEIDKLMDARTLYAYGTQHDYMDDVNIVGWTREGDSAHKNSGLAALITDGAGGSKYMYVGTQHAGEEWYDITGNVAGVVKINSSGCATFYVNGGSNSVWVPKGEVETESQTQIETETTTATGGNTVTIYYKNGWDNTYAHYCVGESSWTTAPGVKMTDVTSEYAKITIDMGSASNVTICFNDGSGTWDNNGGRDYSVGKGTYTVIDGRVSTGVPEGFEETTSAEETTTEQETTTKQETTTEQETTTKQQTTTKQETTTQERTTEEETTTVAPSNKVTIYYNSGWGSAYAHYRIGDGEWTDVPGVKMTSANGGYYKITVDLGSATKLTACFNNGSGSWDNNGGNDYTFGVGTYTLKDGKITSGAPDTSNTVTIYYHNYWNDTYAHYSVGNGEWTNVPGVKMTDVTSEYAKITIELGSANSMTVCFNDGSGTWDNNNSQNYTLGAGTYTIKNGTVTKGTPGL